MNSKTTQPTKLQIADLQADERLRVRELINPTVARGYYDNAQDAWTDESKWPFPAIEVRSIDGMLFVIDGWHRIKVAEQWGMEEIPCNVIDATWPEAILAAAAANASHGVPLTAGELRRAVRIVLLTDTGLSDRRVADLIGVSPSTVSKVRDELADAGLLKNDMRKLSNQKEKRKSKKVNPTKKKEEIDQVDGGYCLIPFAELIYDERLQVREGIDKKVVLDCLLAFGADQGTKVAWPFPPVEVRRVDGVFYVIDGRHRIEAAQELMARTVPCHVVNATWPEAMLAAAEANGHHGHRLTAHEHERAVRMVLQADASINDFEISNRVGCSLSQVRTVRAELLEMGLIPDETNRLCADEIT